MPPSRSVMPRRRRYHCRWSHCLFCVGLAAALLVSLSYVSRTVYLHTTCDSPSCWDFKSSLYGSLNYSISPCDNFYHFVCDGWKASREANEFVFLELQIKVANAAINSILRVGHAPLLRQTAVQKAAVMFKTCIQVLSGWVDNAESLKNFMKSLNLLAPIPNSVDLLEVIIDLGINWNLPIFLQVSIVPDYTADGRQTIHLSRSSHLMEWFLRRSRLDGSALYKHILGSLEFIGADVTPELLIGFENYVIATLGPISDMSHATETIKLSDLDHYAPGIMPSDWLDVLNRHLPENTQMLVSDSIKVTDTPYFRSVSKVILDDRRRRGGQLLKYVAWFVVQFLAPFTSLALFAPSFLSVADAKSYSFGRCFEEVNGLMPYAFGSPFATETVPPEVREDVLHMVQLIKDSLKTSFERSRWMDNGTRKIALLKLQSMRTVVAYPDIVLTSLDDYYSSTPDAGPSFLDSRMKAWFVLMRIRKDGLWKRQNQDHDFRLTDVNAFYQPMSNTMIIPAGIINSPFYRAEYAKSVNFGGLGHVIAHEIVHGFDIDSSRRDGRGDVKDWWSLDTRFQYEQRVHCIRKMYSRLVLNTNPNDAAISEDIADSVGLAQALNAYRSVKRGSNPQDKEGSLLERFTPDQVFYVMSCFKWCSNRRDSGRGYSADELRCNIPLQNIPDFARVFGCKRNDPMNPAHKCKLW